eukprot:GFUD01009439.1.p1 GENE.GFUD01009439.1~~GFUD01009439.1.p1  ORF type:complete len:716 (+),score=170.32 GFUD01009439.1:61-2208(+)
MSAPKLLPNILLAQRTILARYQQPRHSSVPLHDSHLRNLGLTFKVRSLATGRVGPDRILPANSLTTTWPDGVVEIRTHDHPSSDYPPRSVWSMIQDTVGRVPDRTALAVKRDGVWVKWTYAEYLENIKTVAKAFIKLGLKRSHAVGILGFNAPEWHISNIAAVVAGGLATGIYSTNSADAVRYVAEHSRANIIVLENEEQLAKVNTCWDKLEHLDAVIQYVGKPSDPEVLSWQDLLDIGRSVDDSVLTERLENQALNQPCMLVYTSGTTGDPKGVMVSQDNLTWTVKAAQEIYDWNWDSEHGITYLPLSHVAAQVIDIYLAAYGGATIWFADDKALQGTLINTLKEVRPTRFLGVPRVWEKIQEKMMEIGKQNTGVKKMIANWAKRAAFEHHEERMAGKPGNSLKYRVARKLILTRIHAALGLDRAAHPQLGGFYSSAAPLSTQTFQYFQSLDMPIMELLGSSETGGPQTACLKDTGMKPGSVGRAYPHFETKIMDPDENGIGEICTRGRNVFMGYLWDEKKTKEVVDEQGWVHSGDLGRMDEDGFFYVSGRMKEILVTGGGENIAPVPIEDEIKSELVDIVSHGILVGDQRKHLAIILTLKTVLDEKNQPTDFLHPDVKEWLETVGSKAQTAEELIAEDSDEVKEFIMEALKRCNSKCVSNAAKVHKFMIAPTDFSLASGDLTPTLKMKRHVILEKYSKQIEDMYQYETQSSMW